MIDGPWYPPTWRRQPPGLLWDDWQVFEPWLRGPGSAWPEYTYDLELLTQALPPGETDPGMLRVWARNTAKRVDAVGRRGNSHTLFEARRRAGWSAIAQLLGYRTLWLIQFPTLALDGLVLVTETIDDVTRATATHAGVHTWVVGETALYKAPDATTAARPTTQGGGEQNKQ